MVCQYRFKNLERPQTCYGTSHRMSTIAVFNERLKIISPVFSGGTENYYHVCQAPMTKRTPAIKTRVQWNITGSFSNGTNTWIVAGVVISYRYQFKNKTPPLYVRNGVYCLRHICSPLS